MRIPRIILLPQSGGLVHKFWRAHNREYLLRDDAIKALYLRKLFHSLTHRSVKGEVEVHAFAIMSNHAHIITRYHSTSDFLSAFMRLAHGHFGQAFNRLVKRQGAVAYDRPKTPLIQENLWNILRVQFYVEANPLRAGMVKNLKLYKFSSFRFYAWGIADEFTKKLTVPAWYLNLGATPAARQSKYRAHFNQYLEEVLKRVPSFTRPRFIGDAIWMLCEEERFRRHLFSVNGERPPPFSV